MVSFNEFKVFTNFHQRILVKFTRYLNNETIREKYNYLSINAIYHIATEIFRMMVALVCIRRQIFHSYNPSNRIV